MEDSGFIGVNVLNYFQLGSPRISIPVLHRPEAHNRVKRCKHLPIF